MLVRSKLLYQMEVYLRWCFSRETPPRVDECAQRLAMSTWKLTRAVQRETGQSAQKYLKLGQVQEAMRLLRDGLPLNRVAYAAAFGTRATFYRLFHLLIGCTPAQYRRRCIELH
jgi:AraC-like DNA-binding protein